MIKKIWVYTTIVCLCALDVNAAEGSAAMASAVRKWQVTPTSLVTRDEPSRRQIDLSFDCDEALDGCVLKVWAGEKLLADKAIGSLRKGTNSVSMLLPEPRKTIETRWVLSSATKLPAEQAVTLDPPRHWTIYVIKSSHMDIGLHDPQYKQRLLGDECIDRAREFVDQTGDWPEASRFRYVVEGLWWWLNYPQDRSEESANEVVRKYIKTGLFDVGASHSGNHTQVYGVEELCRSAYYAQQMRDRWNVRSDTMLMVDNNGISWSLVTAYADAGIKNLMFLPNAWNPKTVNGSRLDVGWDSTLPHLFRWQGADGKSSLLFWANPHYISSGQAFGFQTCSNRKPGLNTPESIAPTMARQLAMLESKYPYDIWFLSNYDDNETPNLAFPELARAWNARWRWPELRTVGDLSEPFREVEKRFGDRIPTLRGDITGGWAQHPLSAPTLLAMKREADRLLPTAEKLATLARLSNPEYVYPTLAFRRAWDALICNDEHSYGTSYYKGRPVYDTWMQHRDWIERGLAVAETESTRALKALANMVPASGPSVFIFNPTLQARTETVEVELPESCRNMCFVRCSDGTLAAAVADGRRLKFRTSEVPPMGYVLYRLDKGGPGVSTKSESAQPPVVENSFFSMTFGEDGAITGIFDKQLKRQLVDVSAQYRCNQFVYTRDAHKNFTSPSKARFEIESSTLGQTVIARIDDAGSGAFMEQRVTLPAREKRIDIDNRLDHVSDLASTNRWYRFGYYAFPFDVPQGEFRIGLNGCVARPQKDQTGHGTESYLPARDWSHVGNSQFGVTLAQFDSHLIECGKIHIDKKEFGVPLTTSHLYSYIFTDWLYGHAYVTGPSHINLRYRYVIYSHAGDFKNAGVPQFAERVVTPVLSVVIPSAQKGILPSGSHSFLSVDAPDVSLLTLKLSEAPGHGVVARFHETDGLPQDKVSIKAGWGKALALTCCSLTEQDRNVLDQPVLAIEPFGYSTIRLEEQGQVSPAPIIKAGKVSDKSVALSWDPVKAVRQYNVYRGNYADFIPDVHHLVATTQEACFLDDWLKAGTTYYYRIAAVDDNLREGILSRKVECATLVKGNSPPAKVGNTYTGLIADPRAWRGDNPDMLYLQWGQNVEPDLSHYEVFRSESPDFEVCDKTFLAKVEPGPYVVVPFEDQGLKPHSAYYYRVRAVDRDGNKGQPSDLCKGITREPAK